ncbi:hypothetical protein M9434_003609 [Picochlorum sp. BPE23]|nr:hypothetical protein M9434_003609 [Picochlorum sp. BPE23]KAI8113181.1 hypothetical protein M9435_003185 [Picochlorum sp. BPE23]|eukprot:jgi/Picre1/27847/NNA_000811.t1
MFHKVIRKSVLYSQTRLRFAGRQPASHCFAVLNSGTGAAFTNTLHRNRSLFSNKNYHYRDYSKPQGVVGGCSRFVMTKATGVEYSCMEQTARASSYVVTEDQINGEPMELKIFTGMEARDWLDQLSDKDKNWVKASNFSGKDGELALLPGNDGQIDYAVCVLDDLFDIWGYASLPSKLPPGLYRSSRKLEGHHPLSMADALSLGWILGTYSFDRYKSNRSDSQNLSKVSLVLPEGVNNANVLGMAEGIFLARDMISTPAEDMAPQHIEKEARELASVHNATISSIIGDDLLKENYPAIHTVGRASVNAPRLIDMRWSPPEGKDLPKITLVGKGVAFDTGGLDLKPANAMKLMKKDMGGAALVLGLAHAIMKTNLPVQLRVLIPAVENSVSGNAFRPLDILQTRAGITVENGNTDAEGRLILCDALAEAVTEKPDLLLDAATLTGAARVALGTEMPALFCTDDHVADEIIRTSNHVQDYMWRMPLHKPYRKMISSKTADIGSCSEGGYAGAITAALFLEEFVKEAPVWAHVDTMGYNLSSKPGRPEGGEALALRAIFTYLNKKYS